ncbi:hypothetical protein CU669_15260 [Paramagnetospirillum kuznetsovii]|uniref:Guanylate cyclase domain-containing protein n=1 Tax=Paramagnetospirillum kuznetsovii TaxID=2053833 RepID=A0A364NVU3_9PROT|nr:adenylate/guanylate cyclase domain-containing protein [Paramagnetospirillum kuznetsovii]RAU21110.1 hypothetical protein CU669_15260 [Paramagnetospirillum kuznetsovii]
MAESTPTGTGAIDAKAQEDWERATRDLLEDGQNFLAHDTAREGLRQYPNSLKLAIFGSVALSQSGALDEARKLVQPVLDLILIDEGPFHRLHVSLKRAVESLAGDPDKTTLSVMAELAEALELVRGKKLVANADAETYTALAGVFREAWRASNDRRDLEHCRELFMRAFQAGGAPRAGIDAAVSSWLLGDRDRARTLARSVADAVTSAESELTLSPEERYQLLITVAVAHLLLDETEEALASFAWASTLEGIHYASIVSALKQLKMLRDGGLRVPPAVEDIIKAPTVVVFTGHPLDRPGEGPHFPPELESAVRAEISRSLDELGAQVGYSMAACGSDLLFIESMLERGAEVNVVMPYAIDDFVAENVRYGGSRWEMRFRNALKLANTVTYATEERFLGHGMLYRFANQCLHGMATLRASFLTTAPYLLAVWDMMPGSLVGGAADFIDQWEDISRLRIIDLDGLLQKRPELVGDAIPAMPDLDGELNEEQEEGRVIRSMMFCDIAGYSKLKEEHTPVFLDFLRIINQGMAAQEIQPIAINTWGDAIFAVMDKATPMAEYAQTLQEMVAKADEELRDRLPHPLSLRISLHAGPVFQAIDPICGRQNFYGSHINRAARLEPVTVIGHVYATQQFVAVLTAEQSAMRSEAQNRDEDFEERFACEYVGVLSLAKDFGKQAVYHLRRRVEARSPDEEDSFDPSPDQTAPPQDLRDEPEEQSPADVGFSDEDLDAMLSEAVDGGDMAEEEPPLEPLVFGTVMSDDDINALLEEADDGDEAETDDAPVIGGGISDDDINAMLAEAEDAAGGEDAESAALDEPLTIGTLISDEDMQAMLAETSSDPYDDIFPSTAISDDDMEAMLAEAAEPEADVLGAAAISDDDLAAMLAEAAEPEADVMGAAAISDDDLAAMLAEAAEPEADVMSAAAISDDDMAAMLAEAVEPDDSDGEDESDFPIPAPLGQFTALSDLDIASLLKEVGETQEDDEEEEGEAPLSFDGIMSDDDIAALLEQAEDTSAESLDPEMADVAAAVQAAMAKLDADEEALMADISLAPPKGKA